MNPRRVAPPVIGLFLCVVLLLFILGFVALVTSSHRLFSSRHLSYPRFFFAFLHSHGHYRIWEMGATSTWD